MWWTYKYNFKSLGKKKSRVCMEKYLETMMPSGLSTCIIDIHCDDCTRLALVAASSAFINRFIVVLEVKVRSFQRPECVVGVTELFFEKENVTTNASHDTT